eukprot:gnl/Dysnectes_brevis/1408_a1588_1749.p1 GENE.gnl/Dysnectes_brevis/1408_a1588_1749~~gnl/Dysnectes_brevis/1408_a1588_1749.p1  ORF type:complete len:361 (+),score=124.74 gnl/Dysnectes_brevis/1408_a1588_1749:25-1083(+)
MDFQNTSPDVIISTISDFISQKMWFQTSDILSKIIDPESPLREGEFLSTLFEMMIKDNQQYLDPDTVAAFVTTLCDLTNLEEAYEILEFELTLPTVKSSPRLLFHLKTYRELIQLRIGKVPEGLDFNDLLEQLEESHAASTHQVVHEALLRWHSLQGRHDHAVEAFGALMQTSAPEELLKGIMEPVARSALAGSLSVPLLPASRLATKLQTLPEPLARLLQHTAEGEVPQLTALEDLQGLDTVTLLAKARLQAILNAILTAPLTKRGAFPLQELADAAHGSLDDVERLLVEASGAGVLECRIHHINGTVRVTRLVPRELSPEQLRSLAVQLGEWSRRVGGAQRSVQSHTQHM